MTLRRMVINAARYWLSHKYRVQTRRKMGQKEQLLTDFFKNEAVVWNVP
jgi:hypothetical protein